MRKEICNTQLLDSVSKLASSDDENIGDKLRGELPLGECLEDNLVPDLDSKIDSKLAMG